MLKILIYEYVTGGGLINEELSSSLFDEAKLMVSTLYKDFEKSKDISFKFLLDERLEGFRGPSSILVKNNKAREMYNVALLRKFDCILPILPETGFALYNYIKFLERKNINKIISDKKTILVLSDKLRFFKLFSKNKLNVIPTYDVKEKKEINRLKKIIIKDKYGAGCSYIKQYDNPKKIDFSIYQNNYIVQPYIEGSPYSISTFFTHNDFYLLTVNKQSIKFTNNNFIKLKEIMVNDMIINDWKIFSLLNNIKSILPNLYGYVSIFFSCD